jgi:RNA polymerase sigma-70 factor, ECF subfamily
VPAENKQDITGLLTDWGNGDKGALSGLMPIVYPGLRRIARKHLAQQFRDHTLESAALVNEAYLKFVTFAGYPL